MTIQEHWDDSIPGNPDSDKRWERPVLKSRIALNVKGFSFIPFRIGTDGNVFRCDVQLLDGRTLRLFLPANYPCERISDSIDDLPPYGAAVALGFPRRNHYKAVTDADRLVLDLTSGAQPEKPVDESANVR